MKSESGIDYRQLYNFCFLTSKPEKQNRSNTAKSIFLNVLKEEKYRSLLLNEPTVEYSIESIRLGEVSPNEGRYLFRIVLTILPKGPGFSKGIYITTICTKNLDNGKIIDIEEHYHSSLSGIDEGSFDIKIDFV